MMKIAKKIPDLSKPYCHVCGAFLNRDINRLKEWCTKPNCQVHSFEFNITLIEE